ncbi:MAG: hypothetical protein CMB32_04535 [Euryarchaeota archaeon]|nr:hypothetical protein [Euryarchaeota archaeon]|tara:strand:+ start:1639 stop:1920 length:282 start_codon:yes stop_codon:yes gene_type:complete
MVIGDYENSNYIRFRDASLDVDELQRSSLSISPNPDSTTINISGEESWKIHDLTGRSALEGNSNNADVSSLKTGTYTLVRNGVTEKFIVQRPK